MKRETFRVPASAEESEAEGIVISRRVLDIIFAHDRAGIVANVVFPPGREDQNAGLLIVANAISTAELIGHLKELGSAESLELAQMFEEALGQRRRTR
ncbi:MAG: hypothetical protein JWL97_2951 [Gemmatimonadales bacterium]|nr:hypothetical protein [Gemmatimonadales bacterium]